MKNNSIQNCFMILLVLLVSIKIIWLLTHLNLFHILFKFWISIRILTWQTLDTEFITYIYLKSKGFWIIIMSSTAIRICLGIPMIIALRNPRNILLSLQNDKQLCQDNKNTFYYNITLKSSWTNEVFVN